MALRFVDENRESFTDDSNTDPRLIFLALGVAGLEIRGNLAPELLRELVSGSGVEVEMEAEHMGRDVRVRMAVLPLEKKVEATKMCLDRRDFPERPPHPAYFTYGLSMDYVHVPWPVYVKLNCWKKVDFDSSQPFGLGSFEWEEKDLDKLLERASAILASGLLRDVDPESLLPSERPKCKKCGGNNLVIDHIGGNYDAVSKAPYFCIDCHYRR